ncbi:hypothetical protein QA601_09260 [Chitinispirillales bacterium ANBcel5]|uniref:hypothetical protein n=1 Tax=Cellulosispirillum alkaliphilum TaxID=3039283 RepID=UPI002A4F8289|nr:hypothetical protein [Chitinispirillales bacterium ANBcel5]
MTRFLSNFGWRLFVSKSKRSVRGSIIFLLVNFLLLAGILFTMGMVLILLGIENVSLPFTHSVLNTLSRLIL